MIGSNFLRAIICFVVIFSAFTSEGQDASKVKEGLSASTTSVAVDTSSSISGNQVSNLTWSHPVSGSDRLLLVGVSYYSGAGRTVTSVTYNGINLTKLVSHTNEVLTAELWYLVAPPTGTNTVLISFSVAPDWGTGGATSWTGVDQKIPFGSTATAGLKNGTPSLTIASSGDEMVQDVLAWKVHRTGTTATSNQTEQWNNPGMIGIAGASSTQSGGGNVTMSWTLSATEPWALVATSLRPSNDTNPPIISNIAPTAISLSNATISWTTNEPADSQIEYGVDTTYSNSTILDTTRITTHIQPLTNLLPNTLYHYRVKSRDAAGNLAVSNDSTLTTLDSSAPRPNIVFIMTDDQEAASIDVMTNVQNLLAQEGTIFSNFMISYSLCCPSRATFLTGQHAHNHGVLGNTPEWGGGYAKLDHSNTLPLWLQNAGYYTAHVGKYLNGYGIEDATTVPGVPPTEIPPGWDEWYAPVDPKLTPYNYNLNENGNIVFYGTGAANYSTDVLAQKAVDFISRRSGDPTPFFLSIAFNSPRVQEPAQRHVGVFQNKQFPQPPSFNELDVSDKPAHIQGMPLITLEQALLLANSYRRRLESLLSVDEAVMSIVDTLVAIGKLQNTVIFFTSDNGYLQGEHRVQKGKVLLYEESILVPLIIYAPNLLLGSQTINVLTGNTDWAPTILELAGISGGLLQDGRSLLPLISNPNTPWRTGFLIEATQTNESPGFAPDFEAIHTEQYTYGEYQSAELEFYDLVSDPYQETSLHDSIDPNLQQIMNDLQQKLATLRTCAGNNCWLTSAPLLGSPVVAFSDAGIASEPLPSAFHVAQNYPNPFNPSTTIVYALPTASNVSIIIYDLAGRRVRELVNEYKEAGFYTSCWDGQNLSGQPVASGIYIYRIRAGQFSQARKMLLVK